MSDITKITKLVATESFIQVNYEKGYKYIDRAGQLINDFYIDNEEPTFKMNLEGLVLRQKKDIFEELKITPKQVWVHYKSPDTLDRILLNFTNHLKRVSSTLSAELFSRVGWRTYFVHEFNTEQERDDVLEKFKLDGNLIFKTGIYQGKIGTFNLNLFISKVTVATDDVDRGILVDIDLYEKFNDYKDIEFVDTKLKSILDTYKSADVLSIVNKVISTN